MATDYFLQQAQQGILATRLSQASGSPDGPDGLLGGVLQSSWSLAGGLGHLEPSGQSLGATSSLGGLPQFAVQLLSLSIYVLV